MNRHHIIKRSQGGDDSPENRIDLCILCHPKADQKQDGYKPEDLHRARRRIGSGESGSRFGPVGGRSESLTGRPTWLLYLGFTNPLNRFHQTVIPVLTKV